MTTRCPKPPPPGSDAATARGCICPEMDNGRGAGAYGVPGVYWIEAKCPLHGRKRANEKETHRP